MTFNYKSLSISVLILGFFLVLFSFCMQYLPNVLNLSPNNQDWWKNTIICLGINLVSSVAIVNLYDQIKEKERIKRQTLFLSNIYFPLLHNIMLLFYMILSSFKMSQEMGYMNQNQHLPMGFLMNGPENVLKTYIDTFLELVNYYNKYNPDREIKIDNNWWSNNTAPQIGEALHANKCNGDAVTNNII